MTAGSLRVSPASLTNRTMLAGFLGCDVQLFSGQGWPRAWGSALGCKCVTIPSPTPGPPSSHWDYPGLKSTGRIVSLNRAGGRGGGQARFWTGSSCHFHLANIGNARCPDDPYGVDHPLAVLA